MFPVNPKDIMHRWSGYLQSLLGQTHLYRVQALAAFSWGAACARHCHLSRLCTHVPSSVQPPSVQRRVQRLLHNPRLDVEAVCNEMAAWLRKFDQPGARVCLLLDETPHHNNWRVAKVSVAHRRRTLPLVWRTDALAGRPHRQRVLEVLEQSAQLVAHYCPQVEVVLMADRGLCWPEIMDFCRSNHWHFILRAQSQTRFIPHNDTAHSSQNDTAPDTALASRLMLGELVKEKGQWWYGTGQAFAKAGWRPVSVAVCWRPEAQERWILVSDLPPSLHLMRWYAHRMWQEQSFRDEKSHGFCWNESHLQTAGAVHRLLLILALAQLWLTLLGTVALSQPWRQRLGLSSQAARKRFSLFRHGWIFLHYCLKNALIPPYKLSFLTT